MDLLARAGQAMADAPWWAWPASIVTVLAAILLTLWLIARSIRRALAARRTRLEARATGDQDRLRSIRQVRQQLTMDRLITGQFAVAMTFSAYGMAEVARLHAGIPVPANWLLFAVFEGFALVIMTMINQRADRGLPAGGLGAIYWAVMGLAAGFNATHSSELVGRAVWASITLLAACSYSLRMSAKRAGREEELRESAGRAATRRLALIRWLHPVERIQVVLEMARDEALGADAATARVRERASRRRRDRAIRRVRSAVWRLRRAQAARRPWGLGWVANRIEAGREVRAQAAIGAARMASDAATVAAVLRELQMMTLAGRFAAMDYSSVSEARSAMANLITEERLAPLELEAPAAPVQAPERIESDRGSDRSAESIRSGSEPVPEMPPAPEEPVQQIGSHRSMEQLKTEMVDAIQTGELDRCTADRIVEVLKVGKARARKLRDWAEAEGVFSKERSA